MLISITDTIRDSFALCKKNWRAITPYFGFLILPWLINTLVGYTGIKIDVWADRRLLITDVITLIIYLIDSVFFLLASIALNKVLKTLLKNEPLPTKKELYANCLKYLWPTIYTGIIVGAAIFAGTLLFVIPGVIFLIWFSFTSLAIIFENKKGLEAMLFSKQLIIGRWWSVFLRLAIPSLVFIIAAAIIENIIIIPINLIPMSALTLNIVTSKLSELLTLLTGPLIASVLIIIYYNLKENPATTPMPAPLPKIRP